MAPTITITILVLDQIACPSFGSKVCSSDCDTLPRVKTPSTTQLRRSAIVRQALIERMPLLFIDITVVWGTRMGWGTLRPAVMAFI